MRWFSALCLALCGAMTPAALAADQPEAGRASPESLRSWQWYQQFLLPAPAPAKYIDFILPPGVFDKAREDLADLRLYDANGREIQYALRIRETRDEQQVLPAKSFNPVRNPDRSAQLSLDLGANPGEYNEVSVETSGTNFRRPVTVEGSDTGKDWSGLRLDRDYVVRYRVEAQAIDLHRLRFQTPSRFHFLRVHVSPDPSIPGDSPEITSATVYHAVRIPGEYVTQGANLGPREPVPTPAGPGSEWRITFGQGNTPPCKRLLFTVEDEEFVRPYRLEIAPLPPSDRGAQTAGGPTPVKEAPVGPLSPGPGGVEGEGGNMPDYMPPEPMRASPSGPGVEIASGEWRRRAGAPKEPLEIDLPREVETQELRLIITDQRNPPLRITRVDYTAAVREVIFAPSPDLAGPLRLYFGNPEAAAPGYDFARTLSAVLEPPPKRTIPEGSITLNPDYQPKPKPWTERWPWLVYLVLGLSSVVLLGILGLLARDAITRHDTAEAATR